MREHRRTGAVNSIARPPLERAREIRFADRRDAGRRLAALLGGLRREDPIVVGMPRGGVPVAAEVARALEAPLDIVVVRKVGAPQNPEYALGALAEDGVQLLDERPLRSLRLGEAELEAILVRARAELAERVRRYRAGRPRMSVAGRTVVLVDDGLATGRSARAAALSLRDRGARRIVLAVPVASPDSAAAMGEWVDEVVCVEAPAELWAIGLWYEDFGPTSDAEVVAILSEHAGPAARDGAVRAAIEAAPGVVLRGELRQPWGADARGVVAFAHGSGSSARSPRNRRVAASLGEAGFATLLFDLLTPAEEAHRANVFDVELLARRLVAATHWLRRRPETARLALGYFGASTGAGAALIAAAELGAGVCAVVSRGGRPDLAGAHLERVLAPVLLIVGGDDRQVLELNRAAQRRLRCASELAVVPHATHLFEEPGALEEVSRLAARWFTEHLGEMCPSGQAGEAGPSRGRTRCA
jgi:putative phosphoribosyl transferase